MLNKKQDSIRQKTWAVELHDQQAQRFEDHYKLLETDPFRSAFTYGRRKLTQLLKMILGRLPEDALAVDAGCGTGHDLQVLAQFVRRVVGVEPSPEMRARARKQNPNIPILAGDIDNLPLLTGSAGLIIAIEVIRYLPDPLLAMREMARVLKPGGIAVVTAAPLLSLHGYALINLVTSRIKVPTFTRIKQHFLTTRGSLILARSAGFSKVEVHGISFGPWIVLGRVSPSLLARLLRRWEPIDDALADWPVLRDLANHLVIVATR